MPRRELAKTYPSSCGEYAYAAIEPTKRLFAAARAAGMPIFYSTGDTRPDSRPDRRHRDQAPARPPATRRTTPSGPNSSRSRATSSSPSSAPACFYGTPLMAHLTQLGIQTVIVCGESTSGCVRASAVDAYSNGFHVVLVEECCFDRSLLSHKVNLFDMHHKYADVMHVDEVVAHLERSRR